MRMVRAAVAHMVMATQLISTHTARANTRAVARAIVYTTVLGAARAATAASATRTDVRQARVALAAMTAVRARPAQCAARA